jgi:hypothetical protein
VTDWDESGRRSFIWCVKDEEAGCRGFDGANGFALWRDEVLFCKDEAHFVDLERMGEFVVRILGVCSAKMPPAPMMARTGVG